LSIPEEIEIAIYPKSFFLSPAILLPAMAKEAEGIGISFTDIHINLTNQTITLKKKMQLLQRWYLQGNYHQKALFSSRAKDNLYLSPLKPRLAWLKHARKRLNRSLLLLLPKSGKNHYPVRETEKPAQTGQK
jgi:hypothetical protein